MFIKFLNTYFSELEIASIELINLELNLSCYTRMSHLEGLALGAKEEAKRYMAHTPTRIAELKIKLNNGRIPICQTYQTSITLKNIKFPSKYGHMK